MQSLNEVMPSRYRIVKNNIDVIKESNDLGTLMGAFMQTGSSDGLHQIVEAETKRVLHEKGELPKLKP